MSEFSESIGPDILVGVAVVGVFFLLGHGQLVAPSQPIDGNAAKAAIAQSQAHAAAIVRWKRCLGRSNPVRKTASDCDGEPTIVDVVADKDAPDLDPSENKANDVVDDDPSTVWCGAGPGSSLHLTFPAALSMSGVAVTFASKDTKGRPALRVTKATVSWEGGSTELTFKGRGQTSLDRSALAALAGATSGWVNVQVTDVVPAPGQDVCVSTVLPYGRWATERPRTAADGTLALALGATATSVTDKGVSVLQPDAVAASTFTDIPFTDSYHPPAHAFDHDATTAWQPAPGAPLRGQWLEAQFGAPHEMRALTIATGWNGSSPKYGDMHLLAAGPTTVGVSFDGGPEHMLTQTSAREISIEGAEFNKEFGSPIVAKNIRVTVRDVRHGKRWTNDLYVSEIRIVGQ